MIFFNDWDWALFLSSLVSATLFPGGSEALLIYLSQEAKSHVYSLIFVATVGNVLGSIITYLMGKYGLQLSHRWLRISEEKLSRAKQQFQRFGSPALLFAWLPIIGDPLCLVAGSLRYPLVWFIVLVTLGKAARYTLIALPFM